VVVRLHREGVADMGRPSASARMPLRIAMFPS
jgi:hypothetical protein